MNNDMLMNINNTSSMIKIKSALKELEAIEPKTMSEYIVLLHNKCLLYQWAKRDDDFLLALDELNRSARSRLIDDSNASEKLFYDIAQFNYQTHKYRNARDFLEKSKKLEISGETVPENVEMRFRKRLLLCFCNEYIAVATQEGTIRNNIFCEVVHSLVGIDLNESLDKKSERLFAGESLIELAEITSIQEIISILSRDQTINPRADSMLKYIDEAKQNKLIDDKLHKEWLYQIVHALAHCLSERYEKDPRLTPRNLYFTRLAEILMKKLGDEYATCYATLKMENSEYYSALSYMWSARIRKERQCSEKGEDPTKDSAIAEIDFYCWYFSVCADYPDYGGAHKKAFYNYCNKTKDPVANTYYHILNLKELLIKGFDELSRSWVEPETRTELKKAYDAFLENKPRYMIHKEIIEEWELLNKSYHIYQICYDITDSREPETGGKNQIDLYRLYSLLLPDDKVTEFSLKRSASSQPHDFFIVTIKTGKFFYIGDYNELISLSTSMNIQIINMKPQAIKGSNDFKMKLDIPSLKNVSNVLIIAKSDAPDKYLEFARQILEADDDKPQIDRHHIFIGTSKKCEALIREYFDQDELNQPQIDLIPNLKTSIAMCALFTALEKHLQILKKRMDSNVISPVANDKSFKYQYCNNLYPMCDDEIGLRMGRVPSWNHIFESCNSQGGSNKYECKFLDCKELHDKIPDEYKKIDYIFHFKPHQNESKKWDLIAYKISDNYALAKSYVCGDVVTIQDDGTSKPDKPDFMVALRNLHAQKKHSHNHPDICRTKSCYSMFSLADIIDDSDYVSLRFYLYSYLGILLNKKTFLLIQDEGGFEKKEVGRSYLICVFNGELNETAKRKICMTMREISHIEKDYSMINETITLLDDEKNLYSKLLDELTIKELGVDKEKDKYIFISYRSKGGIPRLCNPVFQDVLYLEEKYQNVHFVIDKQTFDPQFDKRIREYIEHDNCIGCFLYLSEEYLNGGDDERDKCLMEMKLLQQKCEKNPSFFVIPVFLKDINGEAVVPNKLIKPLLHKNLQSDKPSGDRQREAALRKFFDISVGCDINSYYLQWEFNHEHLIKMASDNNFENALKNNGIDLR